MEKNHWVPSCCVYVYWLKVVHAGWWDEVLIAFLSSWASIFLISANMIG